MPRDEPGWLSDKQRCASTSNRNFEGRRGAGGRTHLVSPSMAAAAASQPAAGVRTIELAHIPVPGEAGVESA